MNNADQPAEESLPTSAEAVVSEPAPTLDLPHLIEQIVKQSIRRTWTGLTEDQLLAQCQVDTYRASGPGGQKRNKTSSAVRLRHQPSGLLIIAEESRSQHENKAKAARRLYCALFIEIRDPWPTDLLLPQVVQAHPDWSNARSNDGRVHLKAKDPRFWPAIGLVLDLMEATGSKVSDVATLLAISTGNLIDLLQVDDHVWQQANRYRAKHGLKSLR